MVKFNFMLVECRAGAKVEIIIFSIKHSKETIILPVLFTIEMFRHCIPCLLKFMTSFTPDINKFHKSYCLNQLT